MFLRMQVITSVVLWISMVTLRECVALEQSDVRYDNKSSVNKPTVRLSALDGPLALKRSRRKDSRVNSLANLGIDVRQNASFDRVYQKSVERGELAIFNFLDRFPQDRAVRIHVSSLDADITMPILFVVKEQHSILSWLDPLIMGNKMIYHNVSRTLCTVRNASAMNDYVGITVEVSTVSPKPVNFTLLAELISFDLPVDNQTHVSLSASEPLYLRYTFSNESSVMVSVSSPDETCLIFSVQEVKCPVANPETDLSPFQAMSQTVSRNGSITVQRNHFAGDSFFVVLTVLPTNYDCRGMRSIKPPGMHGDDRKKSVIIEVTSSNSGISWLAIIAAFALFVMIYILTVIITCGCRDKPQPDEEERPFVNSGNDMDYGNVSEERPRVNSGVDTDNGNGSSQMTSVVEVHVEDNVHASSSPSDSDISSDRTKKSSEELMMKYKLYFWNLIPLSIFYILPVVQLVFNYTGLLKVTGDQDLCYFNFKCVNPVGFFYTFNNVFSNIGYVMLGVLFLVIVHQRDVRWRALMQKSTLHQDHGIPQQLGLFYAMGIALVTEGVLSSCYHVCPNHSNFQFDTAFMYVMACLWMLCLYQKRNHDKIPHAHTAYIVMSSVIFFQVIGVVFQLYLPTILLIVFTIVHLVCTFLLSAQIYYMGSCKFDLGIFGRVYQLVKEHIRHCAIPGSWPRFILVLTGITVNVGVDVYSIWKHPPLAQYLLLIFLVNLVIYFAYYIIMKCIYEKKHWHWVPVVYLVLSTVFWIPAIIFFLNQATSWHETPARSREFNSRCILFNFYDTHDIWHFLSSMSLFFSFMTLLTLDDGLQKVPRRTIKVF